MKLCQTSYSLVVVRLYSEHVCKNTKSWSSMTEEIDVYVEINTTDPVKPCGHYMYQQV
jgi:hypothetical protein